MSRKKSSHTNSYQYETILDNILWLIENYLPQKKRRSSKAEFSLDKFESATIKKINKLAAGRSKSIRRDLSSTTIKLMIGNWASPCLKFLKRIKFLK